MNRKLNNKSAAFAVKFMRRPWRGVQKLGLVLVALLLCSCSSVEVTSLRPEGVKFPPQKKPAEVKVIQTKDAPAVGSYEPIADLEVSGTSESAIRKAAAKVGADAVIVRTVGAGTHAQNRIFGTAIKYK
jgi:hypothetical protein